VLVIVDEAEPLAVKLELGLAVAVVEAVEVVYSETDGAEVDDEDGLALLVAVEVALLEPVAEPEPVCD